MQKGLLKFILKDSLSLARIVTKHSGLEILLCHIKQDIVMVNFFQDQECIEFA